MDCFNALEITSKSFRKKCRLHWSKRLHAGNRLNGIQKAAQWKIQSLYKDRLCGAWDSCQSKIRSQRAKVMKRYEQGSLEKVDFISVYQSAFVWFSPTFSMSPISRANLELLSMLS
jgi:hypothetical protein